MSATQSAKPFYQLKLGKSILLYDDFSKAYNTGKEKKDQLRSAHGNLLRQMLYYYNEQLKKNQAYGDRFKQGVHIPYFRVNNKQLAGKLSVSLKTIQNLRSRLKAAGIITDTIFHGSNSSYEIQFCAEVVHIEQRGQAANLAPLFLPPIQQNLRHTVTSVTCQDTSKLNKLSGAAFQQAADFQSIDEENAVDKWEKPVESAENLVENPQLANERDTQGTGTGYETRRSAKTVPGKQPVTPGTFPPGSGAPPQVGDEGTPGPSDQLPVTVAAVVAGLPQEVQEKIHFRVQLIWNQCFGTLYKHAWLSEAEEERGKAALAEYFAFAKPERYSAGFTEISERITLVHRWIERGKAKGEKRFVPIPSLYFDHRNPKGFVVTKSWYKKHLVSRNEIKDNELLTKAVQAYIRSLAPGAKVSPTDTYRQISQRLGKRSQQLVNRFHEQIIKHDEGENRQQTQTA